MPWKGEKDPYKVWLSEIMLQQTRVEQGMAYYEKFVKQFPGIQNLADARDEEVFKMWEGLGYYSRCKNLLFTARLIRDRYNNRFPETFEAIRSLKGIGPYTASAIASFCFNLPYAVVDGNVFRVLARVFGIDTPTDSAQGKKQFNELAQKVLHIQSPGTYNQAIMDFGATVCKPALPLCAHCPLNTICAAYKTGTVNKLPVKEKVLRKKTRWFSYLIFEAGNKTLVRKRTVKDIWQNLHEFYLVESESNPAWSKESIAGLLQSQLNIEESSIGHIHAANPQQLTHQLIKGFFITIYLQTIPDALNAVPADWITPEELADKAFPVFINHYMRTKNKIPAAK